MSNWTRRVLTRGLMSLALLPLLAGCGGDDSSNSTSTPESLRATIPQPDADPAPQAKTTYVGKVSGTDALIAVVTNGHVAVAYVCDGNAISEWFLGTQTGAAIQLNGEKGGQLGAQLSGDSVAGSVTAGSSTQAFSTQPAIENQGGIYRIAETDNGEQIVTGWIFFDGEWRGADENSGRHVVGTVSVNGVGSATGSGTGLGPPPKPTPVPFFDCNQGWCDYESESCFINNLDEIIRDSKSKKTLIAAKRARAAAVIRQDAISNDLVGNMCAGNGSFCPGTGFDNESINAPCCSAPNC
ncbi:MAG: hypothetical protein HYR72_01250 [Deltaproteobacteria bacterium]|nr:hypothetical protein [Deltaproteobacteria bacterium]MBI3391113.1 hypothetical protein [Deltaproteobacteria bacterium]